MLSTGLHFASESTEGFDDPSEQEVRLVRVDTGEVVRRVSKQEIKAHEEWLAAEEDACDE